MKRLFTLTIFLLGIIFISTPGLILAADCTVTNSDDDGGGSLRDCVENVATSDGDVITIDPSVTTSIDLTSGPLDIEVSLTINGAGAGTSIIDGSGNGGDRIFSIDSSVSEKTVNISGVTLQGATLSGGGAALFLSENTLNLSDCVVQNNTITGGAFDGGAISSTMDAILNIDNCTFTNNSAQDGSHGGAIHSRGILNIVNSSFSMNFTEAGLGGNGGAINIPSGTPTIHNTSFEQNMADSSGGAIYHNSGNSLTINNSTFDNNSSANNRGGAIYHSSGNMLLTHSTFTENKAFLAGAGAVQMDDNAQIHHCLFDGNTAADDDGGAIHNDSDMILTDSTFTNNSVSEGDGGAIYVDTEAHIENVTLSGNMTSGAGSDDHGGGISIASPTTLINVTIFDNQAQTDGGGIYVNSTVNINNLTIFDNVAGRDGGGIFNDSFLTFTNTIIAGNTDDGGNPDCENAATMISGGPNLVGDPTGCMFTGDLSNIINGDPGLAPALANNGGPGIGRNNASPTLTLALLDGSPALEAGDNVTCAPMDQRGTDRPQGTHCDLGAYEAGPSADLSNTQITFGEQVINTTSGTQTVTLTNNGPIGLTINSISVMGTNAGDFAQSNDCGAMVPAGGSCNIDTTFTPSDTGVRQAEISVDTSANLQLILLLGAGVLFTDGGGCSINPGANLPGHPGTFVLLLVVLSGTWLVRRRLVARV